MDFNIYFSRKKNLKKHIQFFLKKNLHMMYNMLHKISLNFCECQKVIELQLTEKYDLSEKIDGCFSKSVSKHQPQKLY